MTSESGDSNPPTSRRERASASISEKSDTNRRKRGVHRDITKSLRWTTDLSRRAPLVDQRHTNNRAGNANKRLRSGRTDTRQCSTLQIKLRGDGRFGTDDCDYERHAGATKNTCLCINHPIEAKKKVLLLDLREQFHSQEQNVLRKESGTPRGIILQENSGCQWKGMWMTVRGNRQQN